MLHDNTSFYNHVLDFIKDRKARVFCEFVLINSVAKALWVNSSLMFKILAELEEMDEFLEGWDSD